MKKDLFKQSLIDETIKLIEEFDNLLGIDSTTSMVNKINFDVLDIDTIIKLNNVQRKQNEKIKKCEHDERIKRGEYDE